MVREWLGRRQATPLQRRARRPAPKNPVGCPVLVVEDETDLREMLLALLTAEGFAPKAAANGLEALAYLQHEPRPHVILLDLMMPIMDGWRFREAQRNAAAIADIPVVVVSAIPDHTERMGAAAVLSKPIDFDRLVATVRTLC